MPVQLNHLIVWSRDQAASAAYLARMLGLPDPESTPPFTAVQVTNDVTLDFLSVDREIATQHYAFLVTDPEFDEIFGRIEAGGQTYWAYPDKSGEGEINTRDGGRGVYFDDPDGHALEILTRPYGSG
ncbi:MAG TPA: VOC family protein [Pseudonocardiaceae bacterium]|jgi:catechol 2,3-dioxygenase-like lactoylglutathione lyase family enzyme|nr:VOC family protein [Pseudonocardiaceae bacterium]